MTPLTPRETQIANLIADGLTNGEIADSLGIAYGTTKRHVLAIMEKTGCRDRVAIAIQFTKQKMELGMINEPAWYEEQRMHGGTRIVEGVVVALSQEHATIQPEGCEQYSKKVRLADRGISWDLDRSVYQAANIEGAVA